MKIDLAIKFGSNEISIFRKGYGILTKTPVFVALNRNGSVKCFGAEAEQLWAMDSKQYKIIQPIQNAKIVDEKMAILFMQHLFATTGVKSTFFGGIKANVAVPCGITLRDLDMICHVLKLSGVDKINLIQNGACARAYENKWTPRQYICVVDIGKSVTDISILCGIEFHKGATFNIGGRNMDEGLVTYIYDNYFAKCSVGEAERVKNETASLYNRDFSKNTLLALTDAGEQKNINITAHEMRSAITCIYDKVFELTNNFIAEQNINIISEIHNNGILFVGGCTTLDGFYEYCKSKLDYPIVLSKEPENAVLFGAAYLLDEKALPICIKTI